MSQQQHQATEHEQWESGRNHFVELSKINVSDKIEKKGNLSYLSWPFAVSELMKRDPLASWQFHDHVKHADETMMVSCTVTAFGKPMTMHLPVMDNRNNAVKSPDARKVSDAMMRCLVKCIAVHGLGLYIYAGEDLPDDGRLTESTVADHAGEMGVTANENADFMALMDGATTLEELRSCTSQALSVATARKDHEAHARFKAYGTDIAAHKFKQKEAA
jgi:hypothetical protein